MHLTQEQFLFLIITITVSFTLVISFFAAVLIRNVRIRKEKAIEIRDAMLLTQEYERKRIAEDLHDEIGPQLSAIKIHLATLESDIATNSLSILIDVRKDLSAAIENLRSIARNLSAALLERIGLVDGIKETIALFEKHRGVRIRFHENCSTTKFPCEYETGIYRMTLELINNSFKHSNCNEISIKLIKSNKSLTYEYYDNGKKESTPEKCNGMGLQNLKNRVLFMDGKIIFFTNSFEEGAHYCFHFTI